MKKVNAVRVKIRSNYVSVLPVPGTEFFCIHLGGEHGNLHTPAGNLVENGSYRLLRHIVGELEGHPFLTVEGGVVVEPRTLSSYLLYSSQVDFSSARASIDRSHVADLFGDDPILWPSPGPEWTEQLRAWEPIADFLRSLGAELYPATDYTQDGWKTLVDAVHLRWNRLSDAGKAVVDNLRNLSGGHVIASVALASRACTTVEYANAVLSASEAHIAFFSESEEESAEDAHTAAFQYCRDIARVCMDYLDHFPNDSIALLVENGETERLEFKSTLRWDLKLGRKSDEVTRASLKTIAAFLNTEGGTLLIGVGDDGGAIGIEKDGFENSDKFQLHLYTKISEQMGTDVAMDVQAGIDWYQGKQVCVVRCKSRGRPVYLKNSGKDSDFYVRRGPSSTRLETEALAPYIQGRFPRP